MIIIITPENGNEEILSQSLNFFPAGVNASQHQTVIV